MGVCTTLGDGSGSYCCSTARPGDGTLSRDRVASTRKAWAKGAAATGKASPSNGMTPDQRAAFQMNPFEALTAAATDADTLAALAGGTVEVVERVRGSRGRKAGLIVRASARFCAAYEVNERVNVPVSRLLSAGD